MIANAAARKDAWLSPLIVFPNIGVAAMNAAVAAGAGLAEAASRAAQRAGVPLAEVAAECSSRIATRAIAAFNESASLVAGGVRAAFGQPPVPIQTLLSRTLIEEPLKAAAWPVFAAIDATSAALTTPPSKDLARAVGTRMSRALATVSLPGAIPGDHGLVAATRTRMGFVVMGTNGAHAVYKNFRGLAGGLLALGVGDAAWLARGLKDFLLCAEYVYEKEVKGELGPGSGFPMSPALVKISSDVIEEFPRNFVEAMENEGLRHGSRAYIANPAAVNRMLPLYLAFTFRMLYDVALFFGKGFVDAPDAQKVALCELAIMESALIDEEKDDALFEVRKTAPNAVIEFEHYVSLLVPYDGTVADKVYRRTASGEIFDTRTVVPSIFNKAAIQFAQSTNAEAYSLRSFLWLYRDERRARAANHRETHRKFGPETARRVAERPLYTIEPHEIAELTHGGPRPEPEIETILDGLLRERALHAIADSINARRQGEAETLTARAAR